jgi:hypothetical protein
MAAHIDLLPTICELAGAPVPTDRVIDGKSILPLMTKGGGESPHEYLFHIWDRTRPSLSSNWSISGKRYKLARRQLFDLEKDPGETTDIAAKHPEIAAALHEKFVQWFADVTKGQTFEPAPIEVGREDENPVEIQASWAPHRGNARDLELAGRRPVGWRRGNRRREEEWDGELHFCRIRVGYDRRMEAPRRLRLMGLGRHAGRTVRGHLDLRLPAGECGRAIPHLGRGRQPGTDGAAHAGPQHFPEAECRVVEPAQGRSHAAIRSGVSAAWRNDDAEPDLAKENRSLRIRPPRHAMAIRFVPGVVTLTS